MYLLWSKNNVQLGKEKKSNKLLFHLQEAGVSPDRQMKLGRISDEQDIAVYVDGGPHWPEEEGEDIPGVVCRDEDGRAEVLHLWQEEKPWGRFAPWKAGGAASDHTHAKHGFGLFRQRHVVYLDGKAEGVGEEHGSAHRVYRAVPDVEQSSCVVKAQIAANIKKKNN